MLRHVYPWLLAVLITPLAATATTPIDSVQNQSLPQALNTPTLLGVDSTKQLFPVFFCGEELPISEAHISRRWAQTLRSYGNQQSHLVALRERAATFFHIIDPILRKYKIPRDFRFMPLAESELEPKAVSYKGAAGYWQLMPETARDMGLVVNGDVDERFDLEKSTVAACRHLHQLYAQLHSWTLAAAAYNGGITHIRKQMAQQGNENYYQLRLHRETSHYLFRILAYKELMTNSRQYALLLKNSTIEQLSKPLPSWHKPLAIPKKIKDSPTIEITFDDSIDPNWGPRPAKSLTADTSRLLTMAAAQSDNPHAGLAHQPLGSPITKLMMSLMVLRFRRPRFRPQVKGWPAPRLHYWDWL